MNKEEAKQLTDQLIDKALKGRHIEFTFIKSTEQLKFAKLFKKSLKQTIKSFNKGLKKTRAAFLTESDPVKKVKLVYSGKIFTQCVNYYTEEYRIVKDMISEFRAYLMSNNNLMDCYLFFKERTDDELFDYRKAKWKLF